MNCKYARPLTPNPRGFYESSFFDLIVGALYHFEQLVLQAEITTRLRDREAQIVAAAKIIDR